MSFARSEETNERPRKFLKLRHTDEDSGVSASVGDNQSPPMNENNIINGQNEVSAEDPAPELISLENQVHDNTLLEGVKNKAESLAYFIIGQMSEESNANDRNPDNVESTLLRCVNTMMTKHEILFKGMMRRLSINDETAYTAFITVANELFEGDRKIVNWGKIVALYAFGGQLSLYCKERELSECGARIPTYLARYARDTIADFVASAGGWKKICEEYPPNDEMDQKVWKFLTWTAVGLGLATAASFFTSR